MPQATPDMRARWGDGPDGVGEGKAIRFLQERGFRLTEGWLWRKPSKDYEMQDDEIEAMWFLIDEWDFGGIEGEW